MRYSASRLTVFLVGLTLFLTACEDAGVNGSPADALPQRIESEHFVYHSGNNDRPNTIWQEAYYAWMVAELQVTVPEKIHFFKYRDRAHLRRVTGRDTYGFADSEQWSFHSIWPFDNHECVHVVVFQTMGRAAALFDEGIAVALQTNPSQNLYEPTWNGRDVHRVAGDILRSGEMPTLEDLIESTSFRTFDDGMTYPLAGSFVRFLLDTAGLDAMKTFTARSDPNDRASTIRARFRDAYGEAIDPVWTRWLQFLDETSHPAS